MVVGGSDQKCQKRQNKKGGMRLEMKLHLRLADSRQEENVLLCDFKQPRGETSYQSTHAQFSAVSRSARVAPGGELLITLTAL